MHDLNSFSLDTLIKIAHDACLVERYRTTEWVVVLVLRGRELVMNHGNARIFLQGLIYGACMQVGRSAQAVVERDEWTGTTFSADRIVLG